MSDNDGGANGRTQDGDHGRQAERPTDIPANGWKDIAERVKAESKDDHVTLLSAGVAFYSLLALVPGLVALISIYGLVAKPSQVRSQVVSSLAAAPREVRDMVSAQLEHIASNSSGSSVLAAVIGIAIALWSASAGIGHLIDALNVAYDEEETRGYVRRKILALAFTIGAVLFVAIAFTLIAILPAALADTGLGAAGRVIANVFRWVVLFGGFVVGLALLYRFGPNRDDPEWRWISPGALLAAALWSIGSILFSIYTANFGKYNETYGSLGAVVVVMLWLFITAAVTMLGAEVNSEIERQTVKDTTEGAPQPLRSRRAHAADAVGATAEEMRADSGRR